MSSAPKMSGGTKPLSRPLLICGIICTLVLMFIGYRVVFPFLSAGYMGRHLTDAEISSDILLNQTTQYVAYTLAVLCIGYLLWRRLSVVARMSFGVKLMVVCGSVLVPLLIEVLWLGGGPFLAALISGAVAAVIGLLVFGDKPLDAAKAPEPVAMPSVNSKPLNSEALTQNRTITHDDIHVQEALKMARANVATTYPVSRMYGTLAGAFRAKEEGKDSAGVDAAAKSMAQVWAPPPNVKLLNVDEKMIKTSAIWETLHFEATSQLMGATAAFLRDLEVGRSTADAEEAAKKAAIKWAPAKRPSAAPGMVSSSLHGNAGKVYGYMRRTEKVMLGRNPLSRRSVSTLDKAVWTFGITRQGIGANGRPLSPVQVRMEGAHISGVLEDGDIVELPAMPVAAEINIYSQVKNISKGTDIVAQSITSAAGYRNYRWQMVLAVLIWVIVGGAVLVGVISFNNERSAFINAHFRH